MPGDASDSSDDSDAKTNEKACTVKHQITNGKSNILKPTFVNSLKTRKQQQQKKIINRNHRSFFAVIKLT